MTQDISALLDELKALHTKATEGPWEDITDMKDADIDFSVAINAAFPALVAAIEAAREDAERYKWLRSLPENWHVEKWVEGKKNVTSTWKVLHHDELDTAIDRARGPK